MTAAARYFEHHAKPVRDVRKILVGASELYHAGINRMRRVLQGAESDSCAGMAFEDGLAISMTTAHPVRLKNLQATRIGVHWRRTSSGSYSWRIEKSETKNHKEIEAEMPAGLTPYIDQWLDKVRLSLVGDHDHGAMWVTRNGNQMSRNTVYARICAATEQELGVRIYPHAIRHIAATSIAVSMPESVRMIPFILHNDDRTAQAHYNLADQLSASLQFVRRMDERLAGAHSRSAPTRKRPADRCGQANDLAPSKT